MDDLEEKTPTIFGNIHNMAIFGMSKISGMSLSPFPIDRFRHDLAFHGADGRYAAEAGDFHVWIAQSSVSWLDDMTHWL